RQQRVEPARYQKVRGDMEKSGAGPNVGEGEGRHRAGGSVSDQYKNEDIDGRHEEEKAKGKPATEGRERRIVGRRVSSVFAAREGRCAASEEIRLLQHRKADASVRGGWGEVEQPGAKARAPSV
ncbi:unnamed protein product, partial [Ascophyllum nodosum]